MSGNRNNRRSSVPHDEVVRRYLAGDTLPGLAAEAGISPTGISGILKRHGVKARSVQVAAARRRTFNYDLVVSEYLGGLTIKELAENHAANFSTVYKCLADRGVLRPRIILRGADHFNWKGGKTTGTDGYLIENKKRQHRSIMEGIVGRPLLTWESVHHVDENKKNNSTDNIVIMPAREHARFHDFLRHRGMSANRDILNRVCRSESEFYYRFTKADCGLANAEYPVAGRSYLKRERKRCRISGCDGVRTGGGLCSKHYQRKRAKDRGAWVSGNGRQSKFTGQRIKQEAAA